MAKKRLALGRGLGAILQETAEAYENNYSDNSSLVLDLVIDIIKPNPYQPRKSFNQEALQELASSIKEHGLLQPVVVYDSGDGDYVLIAGERRLRASKLAGLSNIRAIVAEVDMNKMRELAIIENIQREELNPIELAQSYQELLEEYDLTHDELSKRLGKSRTQITNTLRLLNLSDEIKDMLLQDKITQGHAKMLVTLDEREQKVAADSIIGQRLSVRESEALIKNIKSKLEDLDKLERKATKSQNLDRTLLAKLKESLAKLGIQSHVSGSKVGISFQSDIEITTLLEKISK